MKENIDKFYGIKLSKKDAESLHKHRIDFYELKKELHKKISKTILSNRKEEKLFKLLLLSYFHLSKEVVKDAVFYSIALSCCDSYESRMQAAKELMKGFEKAILSDISDFMVGNADKFKQKKAR